jgi:RNA-directed DNA polymerase
MLATLTDGVQGGKWYGLIDKVYRPATLELAWEAVRRNGRAAGVDKVSVERFEAAHERLLGELGVEPKTGGHLPDPIRRVEIPKAPGQKRPFGIPTVKDRVAWKAALMVIRANIRERVPGHELRLQAGKGGHGSLAEGWRLHGPRLHARS